MSDALHSLSVSYGLFSQGVEDLQLPVQASVGKSSAISLVRPRSGGVLSLRLQEDEEGERIGVDSGSTCTLLATLFRNPARIVTLVENVTVEAPPSALLAFADHDNHFPLPLHCFLLLAPGIVLNFEDHNFKVAVTPGILMPGIKTLDSLPSLPPFSRMGGTGDAPPQNQAALADESKNEASHEAGAELRSSKIPSAVQATDMPPSQVAAMTARSFDHDPDSETESEEELGEPAKYTEVVLAPAPPSMLGESKQGEMSQDGISSFLPSRPTPKRTYARTRRLMVEVSRDNSTALTIPDSEQSDLPLVPTSSPNIPKTTIDTVATSAKRLSSCVSSCASHVTANGETKSNPNGELSNEEDEPEQDWSASRSDFSLQSEKVESSEEISPRSELRSISGFNSKKRKSELLKGSAESDAGCRFLKVARQDESSLDDDDVVPNSSIGKLKEPSRPSKVQSLTNQRHGVQRASKPQAATLAASTPKNSVMSFKTPSKFLLSGSNLSSSEKSWLKKHGTVVEDVPGRRANFICVVRKKDLPVTTKVLRSLISGKPVVSDQWVMDSRMESALLDPSDYLHTDLRGSDIQQSDRRSLWKGKTLFFTTATAAGYGEGWEGVQQIGREAGASAVLQGNANKGGELLHDKANTILFGTDLTKDRDALVLLSEYNRIVYDKKMFTTAIIRADVDLESDEFKLVFTNMDSNKSKRGRGRR